MITNLIRKLIFILLLILIIYLFYLSLPFILNILVFILNILIPFILSFAIAFVLQPIVVFLQKKVKKRGLAVTIVVTFFIGISALIGYLVFPYLIKEIRVLVVRLPTILIDLENMTNKFAAKLDFLPESYQPTFDNINQFLEQNIESFSELPAKILDKFFSYISFLIVIPMIIIYFLIDYEKILCSFRDYLVSKGKVHFKDYLGELNQTISSYVRGTFLVMLILTVTCTIIFLFVGLDFALFFAIIIAVTNVIPYLGPYIGAIFPVLYALITSPTKALIVAGCIFMVQQVESNFLTPYINSRRIKTHPLIVIITLLAFGKLFGIIGMIFAVPVLAIIKITLKYYNPFKKKTV